MIVSRLCFLTILLSMLLSLKLLVSRPFFLDAVIVVADKEFSLWFFFEWCPISADDAILGDYWLEDAAIVVGFVPVFGWKYDVAALVSD